MGFFGYLVVDVFQDQRRRLLKGCLWIVVHEQEIIGVLQLINATDDANGEVIEFSKVDQQLVEALTARDAPTSKARNYPSA